MQRLEQSLGGVSEDLGDNSLHLLETLAHTPYCALLELAQVQQEYSRLVFLTQIVDLKQLILPLQQGLLDNLVIFGGVLVDTLKLVHVRKVHGDQLCELAAEGLDVVVGLADATGEHGYDFLLALVAHHDHLENVGLGLLDQLGVVYYLQDVLVVDDPSVAPAELDEALVHHVLEHVVYLLQARLQLQTLLP